MEDGLALGPSPAVDGPAALGGPVGAAGRLLPRLGAAALLASLENLGLRGPVSCPGPLCSAPRTCVVACGAHPDDPGLCPQPHQNGHLPT